MTQGGMTVENDAQFNIDLDDGYLYDILLYAEHVAPSAKVLLFGYKTFDYDNCYGETAVDPGVVPLGSVYVATANFLAGALSVSTGDVIQRTSPIAWSIIVPNVAGEPTNQLRLLNNTGSNITAMEERSIHRRFRLHTRRKV